MAVWYFLIFVLTMIGMVTHNKAHPVDIIVGFIISPLLSALFLMLLAYEVG